MSRNDNRRSNRERVWSSRESRDGRDRERSERGGRGGRNDRSGRSEYSESRERQSSRSERNSRGERGGRADRRQEQQKKSSLGQISQKEIRENENAIKEFKQNVQVCELCGQPITDIASAISNKGDGKPVHFDCVLKKITEAEKPGPNEKVAYIGQGKFAVIYYENPRDTKHFSIRKTIEWEGRDQERGEWRNEMAGLYSQVK